MSPFSAAPPEAPLLAGASFSPEALACVRQRAIFECDKWDPQVEDVATIAPFPLLLAPAAWHELRGLAEALARETLAAEEELVTRPELHRALGLPRKALAALGRAAELGCSNGIARVARFDFHPTRDGWRITEVNSDVPGGFNEASGLSRLVAELVADAAPTGDPVSAYVAALLASPGASTVALVHATAYSDDHQVMRFLARALKVSGAQPALISPLDLRWQNGRAHVVGGDGPADVLVRFFPGEWLSNLPRASGWPHWFAGGRTPASNPATALLTQSKRFPLLWNALRTPLPTWRSLLPETRELPDVPWQQDDSWVVKPALGRVGADVGIAGVSTAKEWTTIARGARRYPREWVAQRRFAAAALPTDDGLVYPTIGVFTIDARAVGAYARVARRPLIDAQAREAAVLIQERD
jgi:glutathionylspermidine synthase